MLIEKETKSSKNEIKTLFLNTNHKKLEMKSGPMRLMNPGLNANQSQTSTYLTQRNVPVLFTFHQLLSDVNDKPSQVVPQFNSNFASYFGRQENLDDPDVLEAVASAEGLDGAAIRAATATDAVKARLRANTDEVVARLDELAGLVAEPTLRGVLAVMRRA